MMHHHRTTMSLHQAMRDDGFDNFLIEHIASSWDQGNLEQLEILLIRQENTMEPNGYNRREGWQDTDFIKQRRSASHMGVKPTDENRAKRRQSQLRFLAENPRPPEYYEKTSRKGRPDLKKRKTSDKPPWNKGLKGAQVAWNKGLKKQKP